MALQISVRKQRWQQKHENAQRLLDAAVGGPQISFTRPRGIQFNVERRELSVERSNSNAQHSTLSSSLSLRAEGNAQNGPALWLELHTQLNPTLEWFTRWLEKVSLLPKCACRKNLAGILLAHPPDFSSPDAFFIYSVLLHNRVNAELSKPQMLLEDARRLYRR